MKAVLAGQESCPYAQVLQSKLTTSWDLICADDCAATNSRLGHFATADALISIRFDASFPAMPMLKLLQAPSTGINLINLGAIPPYVFVCNAYGHQIAVAEYNVLAMLACAHQMFRVHTEFSKGRWCWSGLPVHPTHAEIYDKTVCIVGLGRIGIETAKRARAFGMHVIACNRTTDSTVAVVDEVAGLSAIADCVARADFVIVACALTDETHNIVNAPVLAAMKSTAFIINVSRSGLIDEADLYHALRTRRIAGAVLDVWYRYPSREDPHPAPSDFPYHDLDNVIMTPHVSGWTDGMVDRRWSEIARNLDSLALGKSLANIVVRGRPA